MVPNLMRALGYYPSEAEVADMLQELQAEGQGHQVCERAGLGFGLGLGKSGRVGVRSIG